MHIASELLILRTSARPSKWLVTRLLCLLSLIAATTQFVLTQQTAPKTIFRDSDGNLISNNEFVDIRLANFHYKDATLVKTLDDGTVEFRLQKIPQEGMIAPLFAVKSIDGQTVRLADLRGKVVVLSFWFIGCPSCRAIKPKLNEFAAKFGRDQEVVFIAMTGDPADSVKRYLSKEPFDYLQVAGAKAAMDQFVSTGFPRNIVIGKTGEIVYWRGTIYAWDKFEAVVRTELEK